MKKESFTSFMKQVAADLQQSGNLGTAHVYRSSLNAILVFQESESVEFREITPEWLKHFEGSLRARGCSWNTVSTYLRTMRAVYNRAVDLHRAPYVPHLFRSVYTGTRADRRRALDMEDMKKVFARLLQSAAIPPGMRGAQELFILMFLLRGLPFVDLAYLRKSDLRGDVITYRRRKTGRPLSVTLTPEAMFLLQKYMNRDKRSPYLFPILRSAEGSPEAYREYQLALRHFNYQLELLGRFLAERKARRRGDARFRERPDLGLRHQHPRHAENGGIGSVSGRKKTVSADFSALTAIILIYSLFCPARREQTAKTLRSRRQRGNTEASRLPRPAPTRARG